MLKGILGGALVAGILISQAHALDGKLYEGTWTGQTPAGKSISMTISAGVVNGENVVYSFDNQDQGPQAPTVQGNKIRLNNSSNGNYMIIGPVKGNKLPYFWTNGERKTVTTLNRQ